MSMLPKIKVKKGHTGADGAKRDPDYCFKLRKHSSTSQGKYLALPSREIQLRDSP